MHSDYIARIGGGSGSVVLAGAFGSWTLAVLTLIVALSVTLIPQRSEDKLALWKFILSRGTDPGSSTPRPPDDASP